MDRYYCIWWNWYGYKKIGIAAQVVGEKLHNIAKKKQIYYKHLPQIALIQILTSVYLKIQMEVELITIKTWRKKKV